MFCPNCKAEYREGFTHCADCDVDLVPSLEPGGFLSPSEDLALAWRGCDPVAFSLALAALQRAGIPNRQIGDHDYVVWEFAIPRPRYQIMVRRSDLEKSLDLAAPFVESSPFHWRGTLEPGESEIQDSPGDPAGMSPEKLPEWDPRRSVLNVVWSGDNPPFVSVLVERLDQSNIRNYVEGCPPDNQKLYVHPEDDSRAREIVREVVEGVPPE